MKPPFPWFGGKSSVAHLVWERFGDVPNYVEPFAGSLAVLLNRPTAPGVETVNDKDQYLANFWRALQHDPDAVAHHADWPVNEVDLAARRDWIFAQTEFKDRMWRDPDYYDAKIAGWWVWGVCSTIGNAWQEKKPSDDVYAARTHLGDAGRGIHRPSTHLGNAGRGIHRPSTHLGDAGMGIHRPSTHLGDAGRGAMLTEYFRTLQARLERVRVMCGDWTRVTSPTVTTHNGITGMFLDPPYDIECGGAGDVYSATDDVRVSNAVRSWAIERGDDPQIRIALCGYKGEHEMPGNWECVAWSPRKGYQAVGGKNEANRKRERIWFSPHCLSVDLFAESLL